MIIGYARVFTLEQNPDLQINALKNAGAEKIFIDAISGSTKDRPELDKMKETLRSVDVVLVWRLDRLGRSLKNLIDVVNHCSYDTLSLFFRKSLFLKKLKNLMYI